MDGNEIPIPEVVEQLPMNIEAEQSVLGAILLDPEKIFIADESLKGDEFAAGKHKKIFKAMQELADNGEPIDMITLVNQLQENDSLEDAGGVAYITELASSTPTAENIAHYISIVKERYIHRQAILELRSQLNEAARTDNPAKLVARMQESAAALSDQAASKQEFKQIKDVVKSCYEQVEHKYYNRDKTLGIPSGFTDLDKMTAGFQKSDLIIVAARPSVGKTAFALNIGQNAAKKTKDAVAIFSLEMGAEQLVNRMLCAEGNIDANKMRTGWLDSDDWGKVTMASGVLSELNIVIDDSPSMTVTEIRAKCRRMKRDHGLGLVIIDYLQLIQGRGRRENRNQEVSDISRSLKQLARELEVPVIALSQLSRGVEQRQDKRPMMSDLRESGSIEQDADIVAFLYRDDYYNQESEKKNIIEILIAKQRNGPVGTVELAFLKQYNKFVNLDRSA